MRAYFDGLCEPNPGGVACWGYAVYRDGAVQTAGGFLGRGAGMTNNVAEYHAALDCLRAIYKSGYRGPVVLCGDSQLVVKQFTGEFGCYAETLQPLLAQLHKAATFFASLTLEWVPREQNEAADAESRRIYVQVTGHEPPVRVPKKPKTITESFPSVDDSESVGLVRQMERTASGRIF